MLWLFATRSNTLMVARMTTLPTAYGTYCMGLRTFLVLGELRWMSTFFTDPMNGLKLDEPGPGLKNMTGTASPSLLGPGRWFYRVVRRRRMCAPRAGTQLLIRHARLGDLTDR